MPQSFLFWNVELRIYTNNIILHWFKINGIKIEPDRAPANIKPCIFLTLLWELKANSWATMVPQECPNRWNFFNFKCDIKASSSSR